MGRTRTRSPHGAKRNAGRPHRVAWSPDFAPLHPGYETTARFAPCPQLLSLRAVTPVFAGYGPQAAGEPEAVARRRRSQRADAVEPDPRPLEPALLQHPARGRVAHARARDQRVVPEVDEGVVDQRARGLGGVAVAPERDAKPIADLRCRAVELGDPAAAEHTAVAP